MQYEWIKNVAKMSSDYTTIIFNNKFNKKIEPSTLPENLTTLTFGYYFNQKIEPNTLPRNLITLTFGSTFGSCFDQKIELNILPENLTSLIFGNEFNQKLEPNTLPENLITLTFGNGFNQKIEPNTLPENLITLNFGWKFNQKIDSEILPSNLKNINFDWICFYPDLIKHNIKMINNIPNYYHFRILLESNIFDIDEPKWPIHVVRYRIRDWPSDIYEIQDKYRHPIHGPITVLINKKSYQPYSSAKSALK